MHFAGAVGLSQLALVLRDNRGLLNLTLQHNQPENTGLQEFACALRMNKTLLSLDMSNCGLTDTHASLLGVALVHNSTLKVLDLCHNTLTDEGVNNMLQSLRTNVYLNKLRYVDAVIVSILHIIYTMMHRSV